MKVRYTPRAFADLEDIRIYISQFDPVAAKRVIAVLDEIARRLGDFPESGWRSDELDIRVAHSTRYPYRIYYRVLPEEIWILHIRHTARRSAERGDV